MFHRVIDGLLRDAVELGGIVVGQRRLGLDDVVPAGVRVAFDLEELLGPGAIAGTPDDGGASKRPAPTTTTTEAS